MATNNIATGAIRRTRRKRLSAIEYMFEVPFSVIPSQFPAIPSDGASYTVAGINCAQGNFNGIFATTGICRLQNMKTTETTMTLEKSRRANAGERHGNIDYYFGINYLMNSPENRLCTAESLVSFVHSHGIFTTGERKAVASVLIIQGSNENWSTGPGRGAS
jgi:hypothetical protein